MKLWPSNWRCTARTRTGTRCKHRRKHASCELCQAHYWIFLRNCENKADRAADALRQMRHPDAVEVA